MWLFAVLVALFCVEVVRRIIVWRRNKGRNCFLTMNCTGISHEPALSQQQRHDVLRREFHPNEIIGDWDTIVIGSGLSGLSTAKILASSGERVLVLEQHDRAGGSCHTFELDQFEFDVGLHYVQRMSPGRELHRMCSALTESHVQWQPIDEPFDRAVIGEKLYGRRVGSHDVFQEQLKEWFPEEKDAIDAYFEYIGSVLKRIRWLFALKLVPSLLSWIGLRLLPSYLRNCNLTLEQSMKNFGFSDQLQAVCSYYTFNYGMPRNRSSFWQHWLFLMDSGFYPIGGTDMITSHIVHSIEKLGSKVLVNADVKRILFEGTKVKGVVVDHYGEHYIWAPKVVSTMSLGRLFSDLIPRHVASQSTVFDVLNKLDASDTPKVAAFQAYIGLEGTREDLQLTSSNFFWQKNSEANEVDNYLRLSLKEAIEYGCPPNFFVTFPSAKDPAWNDRHPGVSTCQLIAVTNPEWFERFRDTKKDKSQKRTDKEDYQHLKNTMGEILIEQLDRLVPNISKKIIFTEFSTSLSQQYFLQNRYGEMYSLSHNVNRFDLETWSKLKIKSDLSGLYLSGQDAMFCGVSSAMHNGLFTAGAMLGKDFHADLKTAFQIQKGTS